MFVAREVQGRGGPLDKIKSLVSSVWLGALNPPFRVAIPRLSHQMQ